MVFRVDDGIVSGRNVGIDERGGVGFHIGAGGGRGAFECLGGEEEVGAKLSG